MRYVESHPRRATAAAAEMRKRVLLHVQAARKGDADLATLLLYLDTSCGATCSFPGPPSQTGMRRPHPPLSEECHLSHTGRSFRLVSYRRPSRPRLYNPLARRSALRAAEQFSLSPSPGLRILLDPSLKTTGPHSTIFGSWETLREETRLQMDAATLLRQPTANPPPAKSSKVWKAVRVCLSGAKEWHECQECEK